MSIIIHHHVPAPRQDWSMRQPTRDPSRRLQIYGPVRPMEEPGLLARLFGRH